MLAALNKRETKLFRPLEEKMLALTFKARSGVAPSYLAEMLSGYRPFRCHSKQVTATTVV